MTVTFGYLAKRTLGGVLGLLLVIWLIVVSVDLIEAMRDIARIPGAGPIAALRLTLLRTPQLILSLSPFIFLFGTLWAYGQMARMSEIAVLRAAGLSVWRLIFPPVILAVAAGLLIATTLDPLAARLCRLAAIMRGAQRSHCRRHGLHCRRHGLHRLNAQLGQQLRLRQGASRHWRHGP